MKSDVEVFEPTKYEDEVKVEKNEKEFLIFSKLNIR